VRVRVRVQTCMQACMPTPGNTPPHTCMLAGGEWSALVMHHHHHQCTLCNKPTHLEAVSENARPARVQMYKYAPVCCAFQAAPPPPTPPPAPLLAASIGRLFGQEEEGARPTPASPGLRVWCGVGVARVRWAHTSILLWRTKSTPPTPTPHTHLFPRLQSLDSGGF